METLLAFVLTLITSVSPLSQKWSYPEAKETEVDRQARYESISKDVLAVVYDTNEAPLFKGPNGRAETAEVILAIASNESGFRKDVDLNLGDYSRGDGGKSWCMMQVQLGKPTKGKTRQRILLLPNGNYDWTTDPTKGYGGEDLIANRQVCFRAALHMIRVSFSACSKLPMKSKLRLYTSGSCSEKGEAASARRMSQALRWIGRKPSFTDAEALLWLNPPPAVAFEDLEKPSLFTLNP